MSSGRFDNAALAAMQHEREVTVETTRADGSAQRTIIWVVVDDDEVFVRSWLGRRGRWFRAALERPREIALVVAGRRLPVVAAPATDGASIRRCSAALERKYAGDPSTPGMVRPEVLDTTLRLEPRAD